MQIQFYTFAWLDYTLFFYVVLPSFITLAGKSQWQRRLIVISWWLCRRLQGVKLKLILLSENRALQVRISPINSI